MMKKVTIVLVAVLALCLLAGTALAAEIPDPDFFFNTEAEKQTDGDDITYDYVMTDDPRMAVEAYVALLTDTYGFGLTDSYLEPEVATWRLESTSAEMVRVDYDQGGGEYFVSLRVGAGISCKTAETWDWSNQAVAGAESSDITVLPDFLKYDSSGKYYYRGSGYSFRADSTSSDCVSVAEAYVDLLLQRGYTLVTSEEKHLTDWDMYKWYLHSGVSGLDNVETGIDAHVRVRINVNHDKGNCPVDIVLVPGLTMEGYGPTPDGDDGDLFEKDCWWCGYDGRCDDCGGTGSVWKNVPGTSEYALQNCEDCNFGSCKYCGGDGNAP